MKQIFKIGDVDALGEEFYSSYNADYWRCKIQLLKNCHDNFASLKNTLTYNGREKLDHFLG